MATATLKATVNTIDLNKERLEPLAKLAKWDLLPKKPSGKPIDFNTLYRWATVGSSGVKLASVRIGAGIFSTRPAILRFIAECSRRDMDR